MSDSDSDSQLNTINLHWRTSVTSVDYSRPVSSSILPAKYSASFLPANFQLNFSRFFLPAEFQLKYSASKIAKCQSANLLICRSADPGICVLNTGTIQTKANHLLDGAGWEEQRVWLVFCLTRAANVPMTKETSHLIHRVKFGTYMSLDSVKSGYLKQTHWG